MSTTPDFAAIQELLNTAPVPTTDRAVMLPDGTIVTGITL